VSARQLRRLSVAEIRERARAGDARAGLFMAVVEGTGPGR
jgi:hypothetical protein